MNISFFDGVNDGKFYSINAGKYDELGEEDIDISDEIEEEDDADTCLNRFAALEKDVSKLHMNLNNLRNEFKGSCKDWNELSDTVDHMLNSIGELRAMMDKLNDRVNKRLKVVSEATAELADKLSLVEKKLEVFKCIDILDRVTKLEGRCDTDDKLIGDLGRHIVNTDCILSSLSDRVSKLDSKLAVTAKIVEAVEDKTCTVDTINGTISGYDYAIIFDRINELESKLEKLDIDVTSNTENNMHKVNDRMGIIEKKLAMFYDILDRVTKLEEQVKPTVLEEAKELEVKPSVLDDILDKISHLEEKVINTQLMMHSIDLRLNGLNELDERIDVIRGDISATKSYTFERLYELEKKVNDELDRKDLTDTDEMEDLIDKIDKLDERMNKLDKIVKDKVCTIKPCKNMENPTPGCAKGEIHDSVNHPSHYTDGKYETIDFIEEYGMVTHIGNTIKYTSRAGKKDEDAYIEDLKKGLWYLHRYNCPPKKKHIDVLDYCKDKKLPNELTNVLIAISRENYMEAERVLRKYIEELKK